MRKITSSILFAGTLLAAAHASAGNMLLWQDHSLTYLYGKDFQVNPGNQQTFTYEHASGWTWGDMFIFVDQINYQGGSDSDQGKDTYYGEISPRLSFGKLFDRKLAFGPIKDVLLAATYERGENDNQNYLLGPGFDLDIPGFDYFQLNFYYRKPDGISGAPSGQWQITPVWSYTIPVGNSTVLIDGYIDWVVNNRSNSETDLHSNFHFNPQIKYDIGKALGWTQPKHVYVGIEYDYWTNKYGIKDGGYVSENFVGKTDQSAISFLTKVHF